MSTQAWAEQTFGHAALGDARRTHRLVAMAARAAEAPSGLVTDVFRSSAERQGAYDFLEHDWVPVEAVGAALFAATAQSSRAEERILIPLDGTSLTLTDRALAKDFGRVGAFQQGGHGLNLINALALTWQGTPLGVAEQVWWSRHQQVANRRRYRRPEERESAHWREAIARISERFAVHAPHTKLHFVADREADASLTLQTLLEAGHDFTIRSNATRNVMVGSERRPLREVLRRCPVKTTLAVDLPATARRRARIAHLDIRVACLPVVMRDLHLRTRSVVFLTVVWAHERTHARGTKPLDWVLLTTASVNTVADAHDAVRRYTCRWRIEDFHRTWKSGLCHVEDSQLRSTNAVIKWATLLAAVASRAERLRQLAREQPEAPATVELSPDEIDAIVFLKNQRRRGPALTAVDLTMATAVRWIADLGGYVGNRGSGRPGATTIGRGLERLLAAAEILTTLRQAGRLR